MAVEGAIAAILWARVVMANPLEGARFRAVRIQKPDELLVNIHAASTQEELDSMVARTIDRALRSGFVVVEDDGTKRWRTTDPDFVNHEYVFHADGDRVRCTTWHCSKAPDGTVIRLAGRKSWRRFDEVAS